MLLIKAKNEIPNCLIQVSRGVLTDGIKRNDMTTAQRNKLFALFSKVPNRKPEYMHGWVTGWYRVKSLNDLSNDQVDEVITMLAKFDDYEEKLEVPF